jgi:hypothetical protein
MGDKFEKIDISGQGVALGRGASASVVGSENAPSERESVANSLTDLAKLVRSRAESQDSEVEAIVVEAAAEKVKSGDDTGAAALLKKSAGWVLDLAKSAGSSALTAYLKSKVGL